MEELNTIISALAEEGALDSSGVFTLSLAQLREKLLPYRLYDPGLFVLNLLASAVCGGATELEVTSSDNVTTFWCDMKESLGAEQLEHLFSYIPRPSAPPYLRELALALYGARCLPEAPKVTLLVTDSESSTELVLEGEASRVSTLGKGGAPGTTLRLAYAERRGWARLMKQRLFNAAGRPGGVGRVGPLATHLRHFCRFAPLRVKSGGESMGAPVTGGAEDTSVFAWRYLKGGQPMKAQRARPRYGLMISEQTISPVESSIMLALTARTPTQGLLLICRGVAFHRPTAALNFPLAQAVVTADHLEKNLSQSDLVEGPDYKALLQAVSAQVESLVLEFCARKRVGPTRKLFSPGKLFSQALDETYPPDVAPPLPVELYRHRESLFERAGSREGRIAQFEFWLRLRRLDPEVSEKFGRELAAVHRNYLGAELWISWGRQALVELRYLEGEPLQSLRLAIALLLGNSLAQPLDDQAGKDPDPALSFLMGWSEIPAQESPAYRLLAFQKALVEPDLDQADLLANALESVPGTPLLDVWLGWYALFRKRDSAAASLWERAMCGLSQAEAKLWTQDLVISLARNNLTDMLRLPEPESIAPEPEQNPSANPSERNRRSPGQLLGPTDLRCLDWAEGFWGRQLRGQRREAREHFILGLQPYLTGRPQEGGALLLEG